MKLSTVKDFAIVAAIIGVLYYLWKNAQKASNVIAAPIADAIIGATLPGDVQIQGMIKLPDGRALSFSAIDMLNPNTLTFTFGGARYRIDRREGSNYIAVTA